MLIVVDGTTYRVAGGSLLQALRAAGIDLPGLCHDDRLRPLGGCRLCLVRLRGAAHPVAACTLTAADGMAVEVDTPELGELRREMLALLGRRYPAEAIAADPEHPFHRLLRRHGVEGVPAESLRPALRDDSHPFLPVDLSRCIDCYRCVRICDEVQGQFVWQVFEPRRRDARPASRTRSGRERLRGLRRLRRRLPDGRARRPHDRRARPRPSAGRGRRARYCGVGCEIEVGTARRPDRPGSALRSTRRSTSGHLCVKGRYAFGFVAASDRSRRPADLATARRHGAMSGGTKRSPSIAERLREISRATARTRSACSARRAPPTRRTTSRRSSPASCSAPTTSTAARASATRRARPALGACVRHRRGDQLVRRHRARAHAPGVRRQRDREPSGRRRADPPGGAARRVPDRGRSAAHRAGALRRRPPPARDPGRTCRCSTRSPASSSRTGPDRRGVRRPRGRRGWPNTFRRLDPRVHARARRRRSAASRPPIRARRRGGSRPRGRR